MMILDDEESVGFVFFTILVARLPGRSGLERIPELYAQTRTSSERRETYQAGQGVWG